MQEHLEKPAETSAPLTEEIHRRWSPRALDPDTEVTEDQLRAMLEAARWAPSFGNTQPARYLLGRRGDDSFRRILGSLVEGNQNWAQRAGALLIGLTVISNEKGAVPYADYGLGLASQNLVLQAVAEGLVGHQMAGFDPEVVRAEFDLPPEVLPRVAIAIGRQAAPEVLGEQRRVDRERAPRERITLDEFVHTGAWGKPAF